MIPLLFPLESIQREVFSNPFSNLNLTEQDFPFEYFSLYISHTLESQLLYLKKKTNLTFMPHLSPNCKIPAALYLLSKHTVRVHVR